MTRMTRMTLMCAVAMAAVTAQSQAEVLLSNLTGSDLSSTGITGSGYTSKAAGFQMGDNSFLLDSVELRLGYLDDTYPGPLGLEADVPVVSLFDNGVGGEPGNLLITLNNPAFNYGPFYDTYAFTPGTDFELKVQEDYWIVVSNDSDEIAASFAWVTVDSLPVGPMATSTGYLNMCCGTTASWSSSTFTNAYAVNGIIPEPATGVLLALGLTGLASGGRRRALRRRRSQKTHA